MDVASKIPPGPPSPGAKARRTAIAAPVIASAAALVAAAAALFAVAAALAADTPPAPPAPPPLLARAVVGGVHDVPIAPGDSLTRISARWGVAVPSLARMNELPADARLVLGRVLHVEFAHVVPSVVDTLPPDAILVNVPQRLLFERRGGAFVGAYPVAAGRPSWRTPLGDFALDELAVDKPWIVPRSIQEELRRAGKPAPTIVPPGPDNPLGRYWLGLSHSSIGIHATNAPASVYSLRTHGCIRLHPDDAAGLFERSRLGDPVRIVYEPVLLASLPDGRLCLEVNPDAYRRAGTASAIVERLLAQGGLGERIDRERVAAVVAAQEGLAFDVTRGGTGGLCTPPPAPCGHPARPRTPADTRRARGHSLPPLRRRTPVASADARRVGRPRARPPSDRRAPVGPAAHRCRRRRDGRRRRRRWSRRSPRRSAAGARPRPAGRGRAAAAATPAGRGRSR